MVGVTPLPRVKSRERVIDRPNFRGAGRTVDRPILDLLARLQKRYGEAWASEGGLRKMIAEDTGLMPGVTTLQKALVRLGKQGLLVQVWLRAGQILPDGAVVTHGTRLVWLPKCRRERLTARAHNAKRDGREARETRMTGHQARELVAALAKPPPAVPRGGDDPLRAERERQLAAARAWMAANPDASQKPPD